MTLEVLEAVIRANLNGSLVLLLVLAARLPARRWLGPQAAYGLWAAPPLAVVASLLPPVRAADPGAAASQGLEDLLEAAGAAPAVTAGWFVGVLVVAGVMWRAQAAFLRAAKAGRAGPAVVGVITPRIVMPADVADYTPAERALIRAHEREHVTRGDPRAGAVAAVLQCLGWFNPLVHLGAHLMRLDQELACDAATLRRIPHERRRYAETLLKTQLARTPLPFGCYWTPRAPHPLEVRIAQLKTAGREHPFSAYGPMITGACALSIACAIWTGRTAEAREPYVWQGPSGPTAHVLLVEISPPAHP